MADTVNYRGLHIDSANAMNESVFEHLQKYPELRDKLKFIGSAQKRNDVWQKWAAEKWAEKLKDTSYWKDKPFDDVLAYCYKNQPKPKVNGKAWAQACNEAWGPAQGISFNEKWQKDIAAFRKDVADSVATKWHPQGCETLRSIVDHELGHSLDYLMKLREDKEFIQAYKDRGTTSDLSAYGMTSLPEFIAEAWAEYLNNPTPRPLAVKVGKLIEDRYKKAKP